MNKYIAILRGINVGGYKKISMMSLREILTESGLKKVKTYIQSGNIAFQSDQDNIEYLERKIEELIKTKFGFSIPILIETSEVFQQVFNDCPFSEEKKVNSYFTLLYKVPDYKLVEALLKMNIPNEEFQIINKCIYFYSSVGYGNAKCSNNFFEQKLKVTATSRNYKTMVKLLSLHVE